MLSPGGWHYVYFDVDVSSWRQNDGNAVDHDGHDDDVGDVIVDFDVEPDAGDCQQTGDYWDHSCKGFRRVPQQGRSGRVRC